MSFLADRKEGVGLLRDHRKPFGQIAAAGRRPQALRGKHDMRSDAKQRVVFDRCLVGVEHDPQLAVSRRLADRPHVLRISVVGKDEVGGGDDAVCIARHDRGDALVAVGHDGAVAA